MPAISQSIGAEPQRNYLLVVWRVIALPLWIGACLLAFFVARALRISGYKQLPHFFHAGMCRIMGLRVTFSGEQSLARPTLFVGNHISYLDIIVLGRVPAYFIAKSEVANWPVLGWLAQFQNTLFFERKAGRARQQIEVLKKHLQDDKNLILFAEGTSTDGVHVEPFKSTLFESANISDEGAQEKKVTIQAITTAYTHQAGQTITDQSLRDYYAWYASMPFGSHFLALLPLKKVDVKVHFHPVCYLEQFETRKACADHCQKQVADKLQELVA